MRTLSIDIETFSSVDIKKAGAYKYAQSPDFQVLLFAYAWDGGQVLIVDLAQGEQLPAEIIAALADPNAIKHAYNAAFEWYCLNRFFYSPIEQWRCTQVHGLYCGYTAGLGAVGEALGIPQDKRKLGKGGALIRTFCVPTKPTKTNGMRTRTLPHHEPEKWQLFKQYCIGDVAAEMEIQRRLSAFPVPEQEWQLWHLDQRVNARGIACDLQMVEGALAVDEQVTAELREEAIALTGLDNPNSVQQLSKWLAEETGEEVDNLQKGTVSKLIDKLDEGKARRVLEIRKELSKTSTKKYAAMREAAGSDGRVRGLLQFYGANRTGRWAGRLVQVHNLPRNYLSTLSYARQLVVERKVEMLKLMYGNVPDTLSQLIRTAFTGAGRTLGIADYSAIEARVIAWLAGEQWRLDVFATHGKIYEASASQMFGVPLEQIGKGSDLRQKGKVAELALGYQGGKGALISMGALDQGLTEAELPEIVTRWRNANRRIVDLWFSMEAAAIEVMETGQPVGVRGLIFSRESHHDTQQDFFVITLPSGRKLFYAKPFLRENDFGKPALHYWGMDQQTKKWTVLNTYGGKLVENCLAADTLLLTSRGWIRLIDVESTDRVWDGVEWVRHSGLKQSGFQQTISVNGVRMTADHRILTMEGWRNASSCEGYFGATASLPDSDPVFGLGREEVALGDSMRLWQDDHNAGQRVQERETEIMRLYGQVFDLNREHEPWDGEASSVCSMAVDARPLQAPNASSLAQLRSEGHSGVSGVGRELRSVLDRYGAEISCRVDDRAHRCERELRAGQLHLGDDEAAGKQQALQHPDPNTMGRDDSGGGSRSGRDQSDNDLLSAEKRMPSGAFVLRAGRIEPVYDILNAGPRSRFTVLGDSGPFIVHNCVQAIARDCLSVSLIRLEQSGYQAVLHVHDEVGAELDTPEQLDRMLEIMGEPVPWAPGLPLKADGFTTTFYMKD